MKVWFRPAAAYLGGLFTAAGMQAFADGAIFSAIWFAVTVGLCAILVVVSKKLP
jgi:hypothetical protein